MAKIEKYFFGRSNFSLLYEVIKDTFPQNVPKEDVLIALMNKTFSSAKLPVSPSKEQRNSLLQALNKEVLSSFSTMLSVESNTRYQNTASTAEPAQTLRTSSFDPSHSTFPPPSESGFFLDRNNKPVPVPERTVSELTKHIPPSHQSQLHPKMDVNEFPRPLGRDQPKGEPKSSLSFQQLEEQRSQLFAEKRPQNIDFKLPEMTDKNLPDPRVQFEKMIKDREEQTKKEDVTFQSQRHPSSGFASAFQSDTFMESLDNQPFIPQRNQHLLPSQPVLSPPPPQQQRPEPPQQQQRPEPPQRQQRPEPYPVLPEQQQQPQQPLVVEEKLVTLSSLSSLQVDNQSFVVPVLMRGEEKEEKVNEKKQVLYQRVIPVRPGILSGFSSIHTVTCTEITVPNFFQEAFDEPYLWLMIKEWGKLTRVRPVSSHPQSRFLVLRPVEERILEVDSDLPEQFTLQLLLPTEEPCSLPIEPSWVEKLEEVDSERTRLSLSSLPGHWKAGDLLYIYSVFSPNLVEFSSYVAIHSLKVSQQTLTFQGITLSEESRDRISPMKAGSLPFLFSEIVQPGDLFFLGEENTVSWLSVLSVNTTSVTLSYSKKTAPKKITRLGVLKRVEGVTSTQRNHLHSMMGRRIESIEEKSVILRYPFSQLQEWEKVSSRSFLVKSRVDQVTVTLQVQLPVEQTSSFPKK